MVVNLFFILKKGRPPKDRCLRKTASPGVGRGEKSGSFWGKAA